MADLFHRVSIRKYQEKKVEPEKLDYILRASMAAPSACNQQPWEFYIVEDPEILEELSETTPYAKLTAKAPMAIVTAYRKECTAPAYAQIDLSICMENMWLATDEVGLAVSGGNRTVRRPDGRSGKNHRYSGKSEGLRYLRTGISCRRENPAGSL